MNRMRYKLALLGVLFAALMATVVFGAVRGTPRTRGPAIGVQPQMETDMPGPGPGFGGRGGPGGPMGPGGPGGPGRGMMLLRVLRGLDLTEEQQAAIQEILQNEDTQAARQAAAEAVHEAMTALHEATRAVAEGEEGATLDAIHAAAAALGEATATQALLQAETVVAIKGLLTEEQLAKLAEIKAKGAALREKLSDPEVQEALKMMHSGALGMGRGGRGGPGGFPGRGGFGDRGGFRGGPGARMGPGGPGGEWGPRERGHQERFGGRFGR